MYGSIQLRTMLSVKAALKFVLNVRSVVHNLLPLVANVDRPL